MDANVIERLKKYCASHQDLLKFIKGIDSENQKIVLDNGSGNTKRVTIDDLENNKFDFEKFDMIQEQNEIETLEVLSDSPASEIKAPKTMAELNIAIVNKDEKAIDKALETFAINEKTGVIDINKAISVVTNNVVNEATNCIINGIDFDTDMNKYDIVGRRVEENE